MRYRTLGDTGMSVSALGFGASSLGGVFKPVDENQAMRAVRTALDLGVNFIDVSPFYGYTKSETVLGKALEGVPRDSYYLATKAGRYGDDDFDFSATRVMRSLDESLRRMRTDYVDLIQAHDIEYGDLKQVVEETLPALRKLQELGKARFVGITGYPLSIFRYVLPRADVDTVLSYNHYSLNDTSLRTLLGEFERRNLGIINAAPVSQGLLTSQGPAAWHGAPPELKQACAAAVEYCRQRGHDIAQLAVQFSLAEPRIHTTLISTANPANVVKNVRWSEETPDPELLSAVTGILADVKDMTWTVGRPANN